MGDYVVCMVATQIIAIFILCVYINRWCSLQLWSFCKVAKYTHSVLFFCISSFKQVEMTSSSVLSACAWSINRLLRHSWNIVERRYVFTLRITEALCSLIVLVAGITIISLSTVHTSEIKTHCVGKRDTMCSLMVVGFSVYMKKRLRWVSLTAL